MSLRVETNPNGDGKFLTIYLLVWNDEKSDGLKWPFTRNVYIELRYQYTSILQYQHIVIKKRLVNSCGRSNAFSFEYSTFPIQNSKITSPSTCYDVTVKCYL